MSGARNEVVRCARVVAFVVGVLGAVSSLCACSTVHTSSMPTGPLRLPARTGAVAIYASPQLHPAGAVELGVVEVRAYGEEGSVDALLPKFVERVAELGGNAAVIDGVRARFDLISRAYVETYYYQCGLRMVCSSVRTVPVTDELMTVVMTGKAMLVRPLAAAPSSAVSSIGGEK